MKIEHFKELDCWKKARELMKFIYSLTKKGSFSKDFGLRDQSQRAAISAMANIAEGFGTKSDREFVRFLSISIRSLYELQSHLCAALDLLYISSEELNHAENLSNECLNLCKGFIRYLREYPK